MYIFLWLAGGLVISLVFFMKPSNWQITDFLTFSLLIVTGIYAVITTFQLQTMKLQFAEMKDSRELQAQPMPFPEIIDIDLYSPKMEYAEPNNWYTTIKASPSIVNHGSSPAIEVATTVSISLGSLKVSPEKARPAKFAFLNVEQSQTAQLMPIKIINKLSDILSQLSTDLVTLSSASNSENLKLTLFTVYKNFTGGLFCLELSYYIIPKRDSDITIVREWLNLLENNSRQLEGTNPSVKLKAVLETGSFKFKKLNKSEYNNIITNFDSSPVIDVWSTEDE